MKVAIKKALCQSAEGPFITIAATLMIAYFIPKKIMAQLKFESMTFGLKVSQHPIGDDASMFTSGRKSHFF